MDGYMFMLEKDMELFGLIIMFTYVVNMLILNIKGKLSTEKPDDEHETFNNLVWNGWKYLLRPFEVIVSDMTTFRIKETYYELTMYFDV